MRRNGVRHCRYKLLTVWNLYPACSHSFPETTLFPSRLRPSSLTFFKLPKQLMTFNIFDNPSAILGSFAALLTTGAFIPQAWRTWKHRRLSGISLGMYGIRIVGTALWFFYGLIIHAWPVIIAEGITWGLTVFIFSMKLRFR